MNATAADPPSVSRFGSRIDRAFSRNSGTRNTAATATAGSARGTGEATAGAAPAAGSRRGRGAVAEQSPSGHRATGPRRRTVDFCHPCLEDTCAPFAS